MNTKPLIAISIVLAALTLAGCVDESPEKRLASAKEYLQKNDTKAAVIEIKNALQTDPDLGEARYLLGSALLKDGNVLGAEVEFRKALAAKYPQDLVVPDLARSMLLLGQAKKVADEFGGTRFDKPGADASLQTTLTMAYSALGKPEQARAALGEALKAEPMYVPALILSARQKAGSRDFDGAIELIEKTVAVAPGNIEAWKLKGDLQLYAKNLPEDALVSYRKALESEPKFVPAHLAILAVLMQQGKLDDATKQLDQLKVFAAQVPQVKLAEAQLAFQRKEFKLAKEITQQLLQLAPKDPRLLQLAGAVELQLGSAAQAEIYLSNALQVVPGLALAQRLLIVAHLRAGQPAKALSALNAAAGKDGLPPGLFLLAGEVYLQNGDAKKAEEYFAKAVKHDPENARKRTALAISHLAGGQTDAAFDQLETIAASDSGATADLALISAHLLRKEYDKALAAIDKLETKQPNKPIAANLRGRVQLAQKDTASARKSFERALSIDPNFFAAAASLAALDIADKKSEDAKKRFEAILAQNPKNGQALLALAQIAATTGDNKDEVATLLTKAIDANPTEVAPRLLLTELHLRNKDNKQALAVAQAAVAAMPNSPELLAALGRTLQLSGDFNQAIATYGKLVAMQPLSPQPHVRVAEAQVANRDLKAAEQSLRKALEIKPDMLEAQRGLIILFVESKRYQDAVTIARRVQEQRPKDPVGFVLQGDIDVARKEWPSAEAAYRGALQRSSQSTIVATKLHSVLLAAGKNGAADGFGSSWLKEHPKDAQFQAYLGEIAIARKDYVAAERHYAAALQVQPNNAVVLNNLAWATGQLGKSGAVEYAESANRLAPKQPAFMDTLALLLAERGEYERAIQLQKQALELQPNAAGLRLTLAKIYLKSGDKPRAKAELETLTQLGDKLPAQGEVASLLKSL